MLGDDCTGVVCIATGVPAAASRTGVAFSLPGLLNADDDGANLSGVPTVIRGDGR